MSNPNNDGRGCVDSYMTFTFDGKAYGLRGNGKDILNALRTLHGAARLKPKEDHTGLRACRMQDTADVECINIDEKIHTYYGKQAL